MTITAGHTRERHVCPNAYQAMWDNPMSRDGGINVMTVEPYPPHQPLFYFSRPHALAYILL